MLPKGLKCTSLFLSSGLRNTPRFWCCGEHSKSSNTWRTYGVTGPCNENYTHELMSLRLRYLLSSKTCRSSCQELLRPCIEPYPCRCPYGQH